MFCIRLKRHGYSHLFGGPCALCTKLDFLIAPQIIFLFMAESR